MLVKLWPGEEGEVETVKFLIPEDKAEELGRSGRVSYKGDEYTFVGVAGGCVNFRKFVGHPLYLQEEWRK